MQSRALFLVVAAVAILGCGVVHDARKAQRRHASAGVGETVAERVAPKVDLRGAPLRAIAEFALANRPTMLAAALAVEDARLALKAIAADAPIASLTPWNALGLSADAGYSEVSPQAKLRDLDHTRRGNATGGLSLDLLVWDFGRNSALAKAQTEKVLAAEMALAGEGYKIFNEVATCYFTLLCNEALFEISCTNELEYLEHLRQAENQLELGEVKELDVLKARLDLAEARQAIVAASNDVITAGADLMAAMGVDAATGNARTVVGLHPGALARVLRVFPRTEFTDTDAFRLAATNAPAVKVARAKLRAASAEVDYAIADLLPSVSASLSLDWVDPFWYWGWGVKAFQSLFSGFSRRTAIERAVNALESAAAAIDHEDQTLSYDIALAVAERDNAAEAERTARVSVREARLNLETVKSQYELGDVSRVDFTDAVGALVRSWGDLVKAYYRGQTAETKLFQLMGLDPEYLPEQWIEIDDAGGR